MQLKLLFSLLLLLGLRLGAQEAVFPGDADRNGIVDHYDVLPMAYAYGSLGPVRDSAATDELQPVLANWDQVLPTGVNYIHADANADGQVNIFDFLLLSDNYGQSHTAGSSAFMQPEVLTTSARFELGDQVNYDPNLMGGATLTVPVRITDAPDAYWINGIAFNLDFPPELIAEATFTFSGDWLDAGGQAFKFQRSETGQIRIAVGRFGANPVRGNGEIGTLSLVIIEDLIGLLPVEQGEGTTLVSVSGVQGVNGDFDLISIENQVITLDPVDSLPPNSVGEPVKLAPKIYPNPLSGIFTLESELPFTLVELFDAGGQRRELYRGVARRSFNGNLSKRPAGVYYLRLSGPNGYNITIITKQ